MNGSQLERLYDEVVEQLQDHLHRGGTVAEAQTMHSAFCNDMVGAIPQMSDLTPFLKDVAIAFSDKLQFVPNHPALERLVSGTDASMLVDIRAAKAVQVSLRVADAWKHVTALDPEAAVIVIAISYRLHAEQKLKRLVRQERRLEASHQKTLYQEESV